MWDVYSEERGTVCLIPAELKHSTLDYDEQRGPYLPTLTVEPAGVIIGSTAPALMALTALRAKLRAGTVSSIE